MVSYCYESLVKGTPELNLAYRNIPKISPSKYNPPPPPTLGACTWKIALKYNVKQSKNCKFTSNYKASPIDFKTQISLPR